MLARLHGYGNRQPPRLPRASRKADTTDENRAQEPLDPKLRAWLTDEMEDE